MENHIVWESREEELIPQEPEKETPVFFGPQRNLNEPPMFLWNKDLLYLKHGNTEAKKYGLSLHKIHANPFPNDDLEELLTRWVAKVLKKFNEEARLSIQHWKSTWVAIVKNEQGYGRDLMDGVVVKRVMISVYIFLESDYKVLVEQ
ncbi:hypothetical protein Tco_0982032 [Tanacetum coccineum]